ncbi:MAG TPA: glycoside hydrolase family 9 protein [Polyangiaceae bacterium]|nr:glycoside hydrolase family 9 protein [Polyangiaceae bacterium]
MRTRSLRTSSFGLLALLTTGISLLTLAACGSNDGADACTTNCGGSTNDGADDAANDDGASGGTSSVGDYVCPSGAPETLPPASGLTLAPATDAGVTVSFHTNHVGYSGAHAKRAVIEASGALTSFQLVRSTDQVVVLQAELTEEVGFTAWDSTNRHYLADFTGFRSAGSYVLRANGTNSSPFAIADGLLFDETADEVLDYFQASRADDADVWGADASVTRYGGGAAANVQGGWYDASGDISKYLSHLSYANFLNPQQIPLVAWSLAWVHDRSASSSAAQGLLDDLAAEAAWGADYLVRVLDSSGYFYATVFDNWSGNLAQREICAFDGEDGVKNANYQAAWREGGGMAVAALARVSALGQAGAYSPAEYLEAARAGFAHLLTQGNAYANDGTQNIIDDYTALLAATELFAAADDTSYLDHARTRASSLVSRLSPEGYFVADGGSRPFWHASDAGLPVVALVRYAELETDETRRRAALDAVAKHLDYLLEVTSGAANPYGYARQHVNVGATVQASFFVPHQNESNYWWQGENARLASLSAAMRIGRAALAREYGCARETTDADETFAASQLDWILGNNPRDISFLNGFGRNNPPAYCGDKAQNGTHVGGISNGITGSDTSGAGFEWLTYANGDPENCWRNWRWVEQWLPHSTWYLVAVTAGLP